MRAIIIDPFLCKVVEKDVPDGSVDTILKEIGAPSFDVARLGSNVVGFVDDESLYRPEQQFWFFDIEGGRQMMAGRALIMSLDHAGETVSLDPRVDADDMREMIRWLGDSNAAEHAILQRRVLRPAITMNGTTIWQWTPEEAGKRPY